MCECAHAHRISSIIRWHSYNCGPVFVLTEIVDFALIFLGPSVQSEVALATTSNEGKLQCTLVCIHIQLTSVHSSQLC